MGAVADIAGGYAGLTVAPEGMEVVTVEYKINFLASFQGGELRATGRVVKGGKRIIVTMAEVRHIAADGKPRNYGADGSRIDRATAVAQMQKYAISSKARAEQRVKFMDTYRAYIINYGLGKDMVRAHINKAGDQNARWKAMETLLSEPSVTADLK